MREVKRKLETIQAELESIRDSAPEDGELFWAAHLAYEAVRFVWFVCVRDMRTANAKLAIVREVMDTASRACGFGGRLVFLRPNENAAKPHRNRPQKSFLAPTHPKIYPERT